MIKENLTHCILFRNMSSDEIQQCLVSLSAEEKAYKKGAILLHAGEATSQMGMVVSGSVTIESNDIWGNCTILAHVGEGHFFAETYALLPQEVMLVDVKANDDCRVLYFTVDKILHTAFSVPWQETLLKNLLLISSQKNLGLSRRSFHTAPKSCRGRLLSYLNSMALQSASTEFDIPFNRQQLADYLNLERTNMSKELTHMKNDGLILYTKNHFKLLHKPSPI